MLDTACVILALKNQGAVLSKRTHLRVKEVTIVPRIPLSMRNSPSSSIDFSCKGGHCAIGLTSTRQTMAIHVTVYRPFTFTRDRCLSGVNYGRFWLCSMFAISVSLDEPYALSTL